MKKISLLLFAAFSIGLCLSREISEISEVPNQREINDVWVTNIDGVLSSSEVESIDSKVKRIESKTSYEIAVVVLTELSDDVDPYDFGFELFNDWGIGKAETNNGLLILVLSEQRNLTFVTGSGTELVLTDGMTYDIGNEEMKPHFKNGDYGKGILQGLDVIGEIFDGNDELYAESKSSGKYSILKIAFAVYLVFLAFHILLYIITILRSLSQKDLHKKYKLLEKRQRPYKAFLLPLPFAFLHFANKYLLDKWRNTIRFSKKMEK